MLKKYGANINHKGKYGQTDAHRIHLLQSPHIVEKLLEAGLDVGIKDDFGKTAIFYLPSGFQNETAKIDKIVKLLKKSGSSLNQYEEIKTASGEYEDYINPFIQAVIKGDYILADILLQNGAYIDAGAWAMKSVTPLHIAAMAGDYNTVKLLVRHGALVEGYHYWNITPLESAASLGSQDCIGQNMIKRSAKEYTMVVDLLIKKGANVNNVSKYDETPLHNAVKAGCVEIVEILVAHGAKIDAVNSRGETPLSVAKTLGNAEILKILENSPSTSLG
jgi:ankyrin repeat protein